LENEKLKIMLVGIDASRAFLKRRTGIEEYSYQVIRHLCDVLSKEDRVVLYIRSNQELSFDIPRNWQVKKLWAPRFWTQIRLSAEMLFHRPDVLFIPAHIVPIIHPRKTIVTVHGLEYEIFPEAYSFWERLYMRLSIRFSVAAASTVVAVSENTKRDIVRLYRVPEEKISVVHEGYARVTSHESRVTKKERNPYLLFIGRLEERKNIIRIIEAFEILKEQYRIPHELVLAGKSGFGYEKIRYKIQDTRYKIREIGYVTEEEKWELLRNADVFLFPTLYEGFGLPVLEAQVAGVPVVTSNTSSLPEVAGAGAAYCDPENVKSIADAIKKTLDDRDFRSGILKKGCENAKRFSWEQCAEKIAVLLHG
jgi:glycosyltransferase involved in cell wall biosynthesis